MARLRKTVEEAPATDVVLGETRLTFSKWTTNDENGERVVLVKDGQEVVGRLVQVRNDDNPDAERIEIHIEGRSPLVASSLDEAKLQANALLGFDREAEMRNAYEQNSAKMQERRNARE